MYPDGSRDNAPKTHARKDVTIVGLQRHQQVAWIEKKKIPQNCLWQASQFSQKELFHNWPFSFLFSTIPNHKLPKGLTQIDVAKLHDISELKPAGFNQAVRIPKWVTVLSGWQGHTWPMVYVLPSYVTGPNGLPLANMHLPCKFSTFTNSVQFQRHMPATDI
jgi:hypothetical protein